MGPQMVQSKQLVFRTRYDVALFWLLMLAGVTALWGWSSLGAAPEQLDFPGKVYGWLVLLWLACAAWVLLVVRAQLVLDDRGLSYQSLIRRDEIPWSDVEELDVAGGYFEFPALVLKLRRGERFFTLFGANPCRLRIGVHWRDRERLVSEVLARVPHARRSEGARARLDAPNRVAWRYRVAPLAGSALAAALFGYGLVLASAWDRTSFVPCVLALAASALCFAVAGGVIDWEWRWKSWLVRAGGLLGFAVPSVWESAVFLGRSDELVLTLAACLGWAAATAAVCLPIRPRGWQTVLGYAVALAAALAPAWWCGVREPLFSRSTGPLTPGPYQIAWSADGRLLYGLGSPLGVQARPVCHVVDAASLRVATFPLGEFKYCWLYPAGASRVLYRTEAATAKGYQLWALDPDSGATKLLHAAPWLRVASEGYLSPDRREALFLAGTEKRRDAFAVRLADLAVRKLDLAPDLSRFQSISWAGSKMLLVERPVGKDRLQRLALWSVAPGEKEATSLYHVAAPFVAWDLSPEARWAVVASGPDSHSLERWEIVDLASGAARPVDAPLPSPAHFWRMWSPDGAAFGYPVSGPGRQSVIVVDPGTGKATEVHATREGDIAFVALSQGGRYVACAVNRGLAAQARILDTRTGRVIPLRRIAALQPLVWFAWSPNQPTLAVASFGSLLLNERPTALRLYELPP